MKRQIDFELYTICLEILDYKKHIDDQLRKTIPKGSRIWYRNGSRLVEADVLDYSMQVRLVVRNRNTGDLERLPLHRVDEIET